jgi:hypothetical protein
LWRMAIILKANNVNLFVSSVLFVLWYHSPNLLNTSCTLTLTCCGIVVPSHVRVNDVINSVSQSAHVGWYIDHFSKVVMMPMTWSVKCNTAAVDSFRLYSDMRVAMNTAQPWKLYELPYSKWIDDHPQSCQPSIQNYMNSHVSGSLSAKSQETVL